MGDQLDTQTKVTQVVRVLLAVKGRKQRDLAEVLGVNHTSVTRRIVRGAWTIADLEAMADYFEVPISTFFEDPDSLFDLGFDRSRWFTDSADSPVYADVSL